MSTINPGIFVPEFVKKPWSEGTARELEDVLQRLRTAIYGKDNPGVAFHGAGLEAAVVEGLAYRIIQGADTPFPRQEILNFIGAIVSDEGWRTTVEIPAPSGPSTDQQNIDMNLRGGLESLALRQTMARSFR